MLENTLWYKASRIKIQTSPRIAGGFDLRFDEEIPESTKAELCAFVNWVENHFCLPVTLWVNFEYKHYLLSQQSKRVGYLFYWADFATFPVFENEEHIPIIRLPVRTENFTIEEILTSFIEAISDYYTWLSNNISEKSIPDAIETEEILQMYLSFRTSGHIR